MMVKRDRQGSAMQFPTHNAQKTGAATVDKPTRCGEKNVEYLGLAGARLVHDEVYGETRSLLAKA